MYLPTGFTPNSDGLNDIFRPIVLWKLSAFHLAIFNRFGEKIFESSDASKGWNRLVKGVEQNTSTFIWLMFYQFEGEEKIEEKGTVTLVRQL